MTSLEKAAVDISTYTPWRRRFRALHDRYICHCQSCDNARLFPYCLAILGRQVTIARNKEHECLEHSYVHVNASLIAE
jgi:hypothetical protein